MNQGRPFESSLMPYGRAFSVGTLISRIAPVDTVRCPTALPPCAVNQMSPFLSNTRVCGSRTIRSGIGYCLTLPSFGSSRPLQPCPPSPHLPFEYAVAAASHDPAEDLGVGPEIGPSFPPQCLGEPIDHLLLCARVGLVRQRDAGVYAIQLLI